MRTPKPWVRESTQTWYVCINGRQVSLGRDKKVAHEKFRALMREYRPGAVTVATVHQIFDAYWNWLRRNRAESTCERRKPILKSFANFVSASLRGNELRAHHVQRWLDGNDKKRVSIKGRKGAKKLGDSLSPTTVGDYITTIKGVMSWAESMGYVDRNPIAKMPKPAARVRQDFVPVDAWSKVLELATDEPFRDYLTVMLASGARPVEMRKFQAQHLHGNRFILPIEDSKGKRKSRVVYLPPEALAIVQRLAERYPDGKLFRNSKGDPWDNNAIVCRFKRLKRELKMPALCATTLRHSYAHHRLSIGQDSLTVAKLMGHVDTRMLATRYGHLDANPEYMTTAANLVTLPTPGQTA